MTHPTPFVSTIPEVAWPAVAHLETAARKLLFPIVFADDVGELGSLERVAATLHLSLPECLAQLERAVRDLGKYWPQVPFLQAWLQEQDANSHHDTTPNGTPVPVGPSDNLLRLLVGVRQTLDRESPPITSDNLEEVARQQNAEPLEAFISELEELAQRLP